jgi:uncharacterized protein
MKQNNLYPVFLKLEKLHTLLVGGGNVGLEKATSLLSNCPQAQLTIVAPLIKPELKEYVANKNVTLLERAFENTDINNKQLIICATDNNELHKKIKQMANEKGLLVNVADTPELCDFYLGSIVQKGNLKIAISTNGKSPTIAKRVKEVLNETLPNEIDELLNNMQQIRNKLSGDFAQKVIELNNITKQLTESNG